MYKLKTIVGTNKFLSKVYLNNYYFLIIKKIGYNINVLQQTACLVVNQIMVANFAFLFNCTLVG